MSYALHRAYIAHIMLPNGQTTAQWFAPQLEDAYASGPMPVKLQLALPEST